MTGGLDLQTEWRPATFHWAPVVTDWLDQGWRRVFGRLPEGAQDMPEPEPHIEFIQTFPPSRSRRTYFGGHESKDPRREPRV